MKPVVEYPSMAEQSSWVSNSMTLSPVKTTCVIVYDLNRNSEIVSHLKHDREIACSIISAIGVPPFVLILTAICAYSSDQEAAGSDDDPYGSDRNADTDADTDACTHYGGRQHMPTPTTAICDSLHPIEHRTPLFAYRGLRNRHHQRRGQTCSQR